MPPEGMPSIVLDTNVVFDWLLFAEPSVAGLVAAVRERRVRWLATAPMRAELTHVLGRGLADARGVDPVEVLRAWDTFACEVAPPPVGCRLRCSDADDQKFIDLALHAGASWLVSRDRALLRLARRAALIGLPIVTPERWRP
jgi:predicted nucleic acid-binding protein